MESNNVTLNRQLGMREGITITTGTVIGVGLFTTGANCVGIMGAGIILLTFIVAGAAAYLFPVKEEE